MSESDSSAEFSVESAELASHAALPGALLRSARESRGQTVADVAMVIRFSVRQIEAMERDDYAVLPSPALVRGYVRSYARHLKLDPQPLIDMLDSALNPPQPVEVRPPANIGEAEATTRSPRISVRHWQLGGAATILIAALAVAYIEFSSAPTAKPTMGSPASSPAIAPPAPVLVTPASEAAPAAAVANPPAMPLLIEFDGHSWVEVKDSDKRKVLFGEFSRGSRQVVEGRPPFELWIGKASAVRVTYGERSIDLKPHTREEVARLIVE